MKTKRYLSAFIFITRIALKEIGITKDINFCSRKHKMKQRRSETHQAEFRLALIFPYKERTTSLRSVSVS